MILRSMLSSVLKRMLSTGGRTGKLYVEPTTSLVSEPVSIWGNNFEPNSPITVMASATCPSEDISFVSHAHFLTSDTGCFDSLQAASVGGSYTGLHEMGLFWSMDKREGSYHRIHTGNASIPLEYDFSVYHGHISDFSDSSSLIDNVSVKRLFIGDDVTRTPIQSGSIYGTLFTPSSKGSFPGIISLYGNNKKKRVIEDTAAYLANYGFCTLALAYFGVGNLNKTYATQPISIEYFEEAVNYLSSHPSVDHKNIGLIGYSKGGELALAIASHLSKVRVVVGVNACISSVGTSTTYKNSVTAQLGDQFERVKLFSDGSVNILNALNDPREEPSSIHPLENSTADMLLLVSLDDYNWKSEFYADLAKERMDAAGKSNYEIVKYPGAGHFIDLPFMPHCKKSLHNLVPNGMTVYFGGSDTMQHATQQVEMWKKITSFFKEKLPN